MDLEEVEAVAEIERMVMATATITMMVSFLLQIFNFTIYSYMFCTL